MTIAEIFSNLIALLALCVSGYALYLQRKDKRPQLKVEAEVQRASLPLVPDGAGGLSNRDVPILAVLLRNMGEKTIRLENISLRLPHDIHLLIRPFNSLYYQEVGRPDPVEAGSSVRLIFYGQWIVEKLPNSVAPEFDALVVVEDELGQQYKSRKLRLAIEQLTDG